MIKQVLAGSVFAAGMLSGAAAIAAMPTQQGGMQPMQSSRRAEQAADMYTHALNTLYAQGFHGVRDLSVQGGVVHATAVTSHGRQRQVTVAPGSNQVQTG